MSDTKIKLMAYVDKANGLADSVKSNILHGKKHNGQIVAVIDDKTVNALNEFIIAANAIEDLTEELNKQNIKFN